MTPRAISISKERPCCQFIGIFLFCPSWSQAFKVPPAMNSITVVKNQMTKMQSEGFIFSDRTWPALCNKRSLRRHFDVENFEVFWIRSKLRENLPGEVAIWRRRFDLEKFLQMKTIENKSEEKFFLSRPSTTFPKPPSPNFRPWTTSCWQKRKFVRRSVDLLFSHREFDQRNFFFLIFFFFFLFFFRFCSNFCFSFWIFLRFARRRSFVRFFRLFRTFFLDRLRFSS